MPIGKNNKDLEAYRSKLANVFFCCCLCYLVRPYLEYYLNDINSEKFQEEVVNLVASKSKQSDVGGVTKANKSMGSSLL